MAGDFFQRYKKKDFAMGAKSFSGYLLKLNFEY